MRDVFPGAIVAFECLGDLKVSEHRFLDAITDQGIAKLSRSFDPPFTGTHWECMSLGSAFALVSAGAIHGFRYLDGISQPDVSPTVHTVGDINPPFSGTRWEIQELSPGVVTIRTLGDFKNPSKQFLDGITQTGEIGLAPSTAPPFSGTKWRTIPLPRPSIQVHTVRGAIRSDIDVKGTQFTPGDSVHFTAEGIVRVKGASRLPIALGSAPAGPQGEVTGLADVAFVGSHPASLDVIIRATDNHGRTAHGFSNGFHV
jgi:hypothetical protein